MMSEDLTAVSDVMPRPDANLGYLFRLAHQRFRALLDDALADLGMSALEYGILSVFETRPELSASQLARLSQVTRQTMHTLVLALESAGLLERRARNRRVVLVRPTSEGRRRLESATTRVRTAERTALAGLSDEDENTVRGWLAHLATIASNPDASNPDAAPSQVEDAP